MGVLLKVAGGVIGVVLGFVVGVVALVLAAGGDLADAGPTPLVVATAVWVVAMVSGAWFGAKLGKRLGEGSSDSK